MLTITAKQMDQVTGACYGALGINLPSIPFEDAQRFLNNRGYDVIIHRGEYKDLPIKESIWGTGEVRTVGVADQMIEVVLVVKPGTELPTVVSTPEAKNMYFSSVLHRELINKLLFE